MADVDESRLRRASPSRSHAWAARAKRNSPSSSWLRNFQTDAALLTLCEEPLSKGDAAGLARLHALEAALRPIQS